VSQVLWSEGVKTSGNYKRITVQYGGNCMSKIKAYEWMERFSLRWFMGTQIQNVQHEGNSTLSSHDISGTLPIPLHLTLP